MNMNLFVNFIYKTLIYYIKPIFMRVTILNDNPNSWVIPFIPELRNKLEDHDVRHI